MDLEFIVSLLSNKTVMIAVIALVGLLFGYTLYRIQVNPNEVDLKELILDEKGKVSIARLGQLTALILTSWAFVYLTWTDKLTEFYVLIYVIVWSGTEVANKLADRFNRS